jgi:hypothetical protein
MQALHFVARQILGSVVNTTFTLPANGSFTLIG